MNKIKVVQMILWTSLLGLIGCTSKNTIHTSKYEGQEVTIKNVKKKSLFNDYFYQTLQLGSLPELKITDVTSNRGMPYSMDLYADAPHYLIDAGHTPYLNSIDTARVVNAILYLSPDEFSKAAFEKYAGFFKNGWDAVKDNIVLDQGYRSLKIAGLVHGSDKDFERNFSGEDDGRKVILSVWTNGEIHYKFNGGLQSTNLSPKVQMPGKIVLLRKEGGSLTPEVLRNFKDEKGKSMYDYFIVKTEF